MRTLALTKGPLPIVVATAGHTDVRSQDVEALAASVRRVLAPLRTEYPHSQIELLSSLAEGADRVAARVAIDLGLRLVVPLPLDPGEYRKDFRDAASVQEFDELLSKAARSFVVTGPDGTADSRPDCYARAGAYNVIHAHLVLALWDGVTTGKTGGTGDSVRFRLEGLPQQYIGFTRLLDPIETGVVLQVVTPRVSAPVPNGEPYTLRWLAPETTGPSAETTFQQLCTSTDRFNALAGTASARVLDVRRDSERQLTAETPAQDPAVAQLVSMFGCADELAIRYRTGSRWMALFLFLAAFLALFALEGYAHLGFPFANAFYLVLLLLGFAVLVWGRSRGYADNYLDYRALAEGLRVQYYWHVAGIRSSAADYYMRYRVRESEWVRTALRSFDLSNNTYAPQHQTPTPEALAFVTRTWVDGQYDFFSRAEKSEASRLERREHLVWGLFFGSVIGFVAYVALRSWWGSGGSPDEVLQHENVLHVIFGMSAISAGGAAMLHGYLEKLALAAHTKRYARMEGLFRSARKRLQDSAHQPLVVRTVLEELGREALEENADWVMLHRDRPLELPK